MCSYKQNQGYWNVPIKRESGIGEYAHINRIRVKGKVPIKRQSGLVEDARENEISLRGRCPYKQNQG